VARRQASENGSYTVNEVPREGSTVVVEINQIEVANRQIIFTPASAVYQDFSVDWAQFIGSKDKIGVVSVGSTYERSRENQDRLDRAVADISKGKNESAITLLQAVLKNDPKDFYVWVQLGNAYFLNKDKKNAESSYQRAIAERPSFALALINLGKLYLSQNENDNAVAALTKAVESEPTSADAQHYLGEAYLAIKKGSKAVIYLNEAIRLAPIEKAEVHLRLAALYNGAGLKGRASNEYQKFLEKTPNYPKRDELRKYIAENPPTQ
jgi:tetratricopeptide (TPR) repeat protein